MLVAMVWILTPLLVGWDHMEVKIAQVILAEVSQSNPGNDTTLSMLTVCCQVSGLVHMVPGAY